MRRLGMSFVNFLVIFIALFIALSAQSAKASFGLIYGQEYRYQKVQSQATELIRPSTLSLVLDMQKDWYRFDITTLNFRDGNSTLWVNNVHREYMVWAAAKLYEGTIIEPFIGAGLGFFDNLVTTSLYGVELQDRSIKYGMYGLNLGAHLRYKFLLFGLEGRLLQAQGMEPKPQYSGLMKMGLLF